MKLKPGDFFCCYSGGLFAKGILLYEIHDSPDHKAKLSHSGIILNRNGDTFESLRTIRKGYIRKYEGKPLLIGRHLLMSSERAARAIPYMLDCWEGRQYPWWRILFHLVGCENLGCGDYLVCSELVMRFLKECGITKDYLGWTPDEIADWMFFDPLIEIVYREDC